MESSPENNNDLGTFKENQKFIKENILSFFPYFQPKKILNESGVIEEKGEYGNFFVYPTDANQEPWVKKQYVKIIENINHYVFPVRSLVINKNVELIIYYAFCINKQLLANLLIETNNNPEQHLYKIFSKIKTELNSKNHTKDNYYSQTDYSVFGEYCLYDSILSTILIIAEFCSDGYDLEDSEDQVFFLKSLEKNFNDFNIKTGTFIYGKESKRQKLEYRLQRLGIKNDIIEDISLPDDSIILSRLKNQITKEDFQNALDVVCQAFNIIFEATYSDRYKRSIEITRMETNFSDIERQEYLRLIGGSKGYYVENYKNKIDQLNEIKFSNDIKKQK